MIDLEDLPPIEFQCPQCGAKDSADPILLATNYAFCDACNAVLDVTPSFDVKVFAVMAVADGPDDDDEDVAEIESDMPGEGFE